MMNQRNLKVNTGSAAVIYTSAAHCLLTVSNFYSYHVIYFIHVIVFIPIVSSTLTALFIVGYLIAIKSFQCWIPKLIH